MAFSDFVAATNGTPNPAHIFDLLQKETAELGFDWVALGALTPQAAAPQKKLPAPAVALNYPQDWVEHYFKQNYEKIDPVVMHSQVTLSPLFWSDCLERISLNRAQRQIFLEAREVGLNDGISIPIHAPFGGAYVLSLASSLGGAEPKVHVAHLRALAMQFFVTYADVSPPQPGIHLTARERDCLLWSARGKSNWDIGSILKISEHTVDFHFRKAMAKLNCNNRVVAVVAAMRYGLINP